MRLSWLVVLLTIGLCSARDWYVGPNGKPNASGTVDDPFDSLGSLIANLTDSDRVIHLPGVYDGQSIEVEIEDLSITIQGPGAKFTNSWVDISATDCSPSWLTVRDLVFEDSNVTISSYKCGLEVINCHFTRCQPVQSQGIVAFWAEVGDMSLLAGSVFDSCVNPTDDPDEEAGIVGCFRESNEDATIDNCEFKNNAMVQHAVVHFPMDTINLLTIKRCKFRNNQAVAVRVAMGSLSVAASEFTSNYPIPAPDAAGAAIHFYSPGTDAVGLRVVESTFASNSAARGGAIHYHASFGTFVCMNNSFTMNHAYGYYLANGTFPVDGGGAINIVTRDQGSVDLHSNTFIANNASQDGGAIRMDAMSVEVIMTANIFRYNVAGQNGGAMWSVHTSDTSMRVADGVFSSNIADKDGGALWTAFRLDGRQAICRFWQVINTKFEYNHAYSAGAVRILKRFGPTGGLPCSQSLSPPMFSQCSFTGNLASVSSGAIGLSTSSLVLAGCQLHGNQVVQSTTGSAITCDVATLRLNQGTDLSGNGDPANSGSQISCHVCAYSADAITAGDAYSQCPVASNDTPFAQTAGGIILILFLVLGTVGGIAYAAQKGWLRVGKRGGSSNDDEKRTTARPAASLNSTTQDEREEPDTQSLMASSQKKSSGYGSSDVSV